MFELLWLRSLQRRLFPRRVFRPAPSRRHVRAHLEVLEGRLTPSTFTVTDVKDAPGSANDVTLRYAISQAISSGDQNAVIAFSSALAGKTITLSQTDSYNAYGPTAFVVNNATITIDGSNAPGLILSGNNALRPFAVTSTGNLTPENLTVQGGLAQGGAGGVGSYGGGGGGGAGLGGAVYDDGGGFTAQGVTFTNNTAQGGNGGYIDGSGYGEGGGGGGLGVSGQSGSSGGAGGGSGGNGGKGYYGGGGSSGGIGGGGGGARANGGGYGGFGGGGAGGGGGPSDANYNDGAAGGLGGGRGHHGGSYGGGPGGGGGGMGGALFSNGGSLTLINDTFTTNTAQGGVGGNSHTGVFGANGSGVGGAVFARNGTLTATFDTFSSNTAAQGGTDVYVLSDGTGTAPTATLVDDILGQTSGSVSDFIANSINGGVAANLSGSSQDLVRNNPSSGGLPAAAVLSSADPLLSPLANNGGPTQTMAINSRSPAFHAGIPINGIATDQRGSARPTTNPSLGAFEPLPKSSTTPTASVAPPASAAAAPTSAGLVGLAAEEFELILDSVLAVVETRLQMPHASLDVAIAQLHEAIAHDPLQSTFPGELGILLGQIASLNFLRGG